MLTIALAQKFGLTDQIRQQFALHRAQTEKITRAIPGTRSYGEYDVPEPEPLPTVDEIIGFLWVLQHDRSLIDRFQR